MPVRSPRFFPLCAMLWALSGPGAAGNPIELKVAADDLPELEARISSAFEGVPLHGYLPVRIQLKNPTARTRSCRFKGTLKTQSYGQGSLQGSHSIEIACPPGAEIARDILVSAPPTLRDSHGRTGRFSIDLPGSGAGVPHDYHHTQATPKWPAIGIGKSLANRNLEELKNEAKKRNAMAEDFGLVVHADRLPDDWRALGGLDVLILTSKEWQGMDIRQRAAVLDWIHLGGTLDLYAAPGAGTLDELGFTGETGGGNGHRSALEVRGLGRIRLFPLEGEILDPKMVCQRVTKMAVRNRGKELSGDFKGSWQLSKDLEIRKFHTPLWFGLLLLFGILMGPINLFVLAGKNRRHRLFITTPVIALATSLLLGALILIIDGTGGRGHRFATLELQPGKGGRRAYLNQESLLSTGLLTATSFTEKHPSMHLPVALERSRWSRITGDHGDDGTLDVSEQGEFRGDWLKSRSRHGFVSQTVVPSRARFELSGTPDQPGLVSGLGFPTGRVFYVSPDGAFWKSEAESTTTGERVTLVPSNRNELEAWRKEAIDRASSGLRRDLREQPVRPGYFYAAAGETGMELSFADSIRWEKTTTFLSGPVLGGAAPEETGKKAQQAREG